MVTSAAAANVVSLEPRRSRRAARRRSPEFMAAMRRHPSYQGARPEAHEERDDALVLFLRRR